MPYLKKISFNWTRAGKVKTYPFSIPSLRNTESIDTDHNVIFFVGENGTGKSTLLEAVANKCGFGIKSGSRSNIFDDSVDNVSLESIITLSWFPKITRGFFLRAEAFFDFAGYIDEIAKEAGPEAYEPYGGKSLLSQSHGESFMSLFQNRFQNRGIYILDEPEAALSVQRQLGFLRLLWELDREGGSQFLIATHSPILMSYPGAVIYSFDRENIERISYEETEHYRLTKDFLNNKEQYFKYLFND